MKVRRILHVDAPHMCAGAVWERGPKRWRCVREGTAPILRWMEWKTTEQVKQWLDRKGYTYYVGPEFTVEDGGEYED